MQTDPIRDLMERVSSSNLQEWVNHISSDPLPFRKLNYTIPGHEKCTLYEMDDFVEGKLREWGWATRKDDTRVQAYRCDETKNIHHRYSPPDPADPWYTAHNIFAEKPGSDVPEEIIVAIAHKDSQSWIDSPGANDNAIGTAGVLELARLLADYPCRRSLRLIWCNEEHSPWTSVTAAQAARDLGENIIAVFNVDGLGRKSAEDTEAGRMKHVTCFTLPEGERIADLIGRVIEGYGIGLEFSKYQRPSPGDDDGSFVNAGFPAAVVNIGSYPYGDPNYHLETDTADTVDAPNAALSVQAILAAMLLIDRDGAA